MKKSDKYQYISVKWLHTLSDKPIMLVLELDETRMEKRKIEYFASGVVGLASKNHESKNTVLCSEPVPEVKKINSNKEYKAVSITRSEFEAQWQVYV